MNGRYRKKHVGRTPKNKHFRRYKKKIKISDEEFPYDELPEEMVE